MTPIPALPLLPPRLFRALPTPPSPAPSSASWAVPTTSPPPSLPPRAALPPPGSPTKTTATAPSTSSIPAPPTLPPRQRLFPHWRRLLYRVPRPQPQWQQQFRRRFLVPGHPPPPLYQQFHERYRHRRHRHPRLRLPHRRPQPHLPQRLHAGLHSRPPVVRLDQRHLLQLQPVVRYLPRLPQHHLQQHRRRRIRLLLQPHRRQRHHPRSLQRLL